MKLLSGIFRNQFHITELLSKPYSLRQRGNSRSTIVIFRRHIQSVTHCSALKVSSSVTTLTNLLITYLLTP